MIVWVRGCLFVGGVASLTLLFGREHSSRLGDCVNRPEALETQADTPSAVCDAQQRSTLYIWLTSVHTYNTYPHRCREQWAWALKQRPYATPTWWVVFCFFSLSLKSFSAVSVFVERRARNRPMTRGIPMHLTNFRVLWTSCSSTRGVVLRGALATTSPPPLLQPSFPWPLWWW